MAHPTRDEQAEAREIFDHFDRDRSGKMEISEFVSLMKALDALGDPDELVAGLGAVDTDNDGRIDFEEFLDFWLDR